MQEITNNIQDVIHSTTESTKLIETGTESVRLTAESLCEVSKAVVETMVKVFERIVHQFTIMMQQKLAIPGITSRSHTLFLHKKRS